MATWLKPPTKQIRARLIRDHVTAGCYDGAVIFSCGNAARALKAELGDVLAIAPGHELVAGRWWSPADIARVWPRRFDATSGHLPVHLMLQLGRALRGHVGNLGPGPYWVPTGSGETVMALRWTYSSTVFVACYDDKVPATRYEALAPLAPLVFNTGPVLHLDA